MINPHPAPKPSVLERFRPALEGALKARIGTANSPLHDMLRYQLGWIDERGLPVAESHGDHLHGVIALLAAEAVAGDWEVGLAAAVAIELAHGSSVVLDDVRLGNPARDNRPALWWAWGHSQGINAGDGMYAFARLSVMDVADVVQPECILQASRVLDEACLEIHQGRSVEIDLGAEALLTPEASLCAIQRESGLLMGTGAAMGTILAGADCSTTTALRQFGSNLGVAWRIRRDIDDLWSLGGEARLVALLDGMRSLPISRALTNLNPSQHSRLAALARREATLGNNEIAELRELIDQSGARSATESDLATAVRRATTSLDHADLNLRATGDLRALAEYFLVS